MSGTTLPASRLAIIGQGYVGLPLAMRAVEVGYHVVGYDVDASRVTGLSRGSSHVEDVDRAVLQAALDSGRYRPSADESDLDGFEVALITVPTPLKSGNPDLTHIEAAAETLARHLSRGSLVVLESTTYPGTTTELVVPALERGSGLMAGSDFHVGYSPERIDPGNTQWNVVNTPKIVSGIDGKSLDAVRAFYDSIVQYTIPVSGTAEAELTKLIENTFRHVNVALVNELAMFANGLGVDIWESIEAASTKPFGFMPFQPGPGVGGHCLPVDPSYLSWSVKENLGTEFRFIELANEINAYMPEHVTRRVREILSSNFIEVSGSTVLLLGLSYKANTGDARESPSIMVAERLRAAGARVRAADPYVRVDETDAGLTRVEATIEEASSADIVVLLVAHDSFDLDALAPAAKLLLDTRHRIRGDHVFYL